jgi:LacI family transcriptional regulator, gluconate utilization system Gnt-I transcriptional repressor
MSSTGVLTSRRNHGRATLADVAASAGVTTMTVSRYLRSPERVSAHTGQDISRALHETGYTPNLQAGSLASGRSQAVAVIVPNIAHSIFADTLHGLGTGLQALGLHMLVLSSDYSLAQEESHVRTVLGWAPAALVVTGRQHLPNTQQLLLAAQARGTPVVEMWDQSPPGETPVFAQIGMAHAQVGAAMASALLNRGFQRLCFMNSSVAGDIRALERCGGFMAQARRVGVPVSSLDVLPGDLVEMSRQRFADWHAEQNSANFLPCGMGFANDLLGTGALLQAHALGYRLPHDLGLLGFGDFPAGRYCHGGLSTMHIDGERLGQMCAEHIATQRQLQRTSALNTQRPQQMSLEPRLVWRDF